MILLEVKGDLPCHCDTLRVRGDERHYRSELLLLSMFGPRNAVRAAWAKLSKGASRGGHRESIDVGGTSVAKSDAAYFTGFAPLGRGLLHCLIYHHELSHNAPNLGRVLQVGPDAGRRYFDRLARWCPVPMRSEWRAPLWDLGRAKGAIVEMRGHGREVWHVDTTRETWEPIIRDALVTGELR
jgi:hypothetical protein